MPVKFVIDGIEVTGGRDGKYEWSLTDKAWTWVDGKRPPAPNYVSVVALDALYVHTVESLRRDAEKWDEIFADIVAHVLDDRQVADALPLKVYDDYSSYEGTPNDTALSTHAEQVPSEEMRGAYERAMAANLFLRGGRPTGPSPAKSLTKIRADIRDDMGIAMGLHGDRHGMTWRSP